MRHHRHKRPVIRRQGRQLQAATGVGHRDLVRQAKKWLLFEQVPFSNSNANFSFGYNNINISTTNAGVASAVYNRLITQAALTYEEYRIRRVSVRAQPGAGYTNDDRIKTSIFARVDVNTQPTTATNDNLNSLICAESSVNRTFVERSNVHLTDYRPICFSTGGTGASSRPILPSQMQWYNIDERDSHLWRGSTVAPVIPEIVSPGDLSVTVWVEVEMEFRSRRPDFANFTRDIISVADNQGDETESTSTIKADTSKENGDDVQLTV
jgi:hypothetical protein